MDTLAPPDAAEQSVAVFFRPIPLDQISASSHQARKTFDETALQGLAESLKQEGLIQPVTVRRLPTQENEPPRFELISGERRYRAARLLGWKAIEARILDGVSEGEAAAKGLIENLQREDLNPIEEAEGFARLNAVDPSYWTQERVASVSGKSRSYVTQSLGLMHLPSEIQDDIRKKAYSRGHALELTRLPSQESQVQVAQQIRQGLTREKTRALVDRVLGSARSRRQTDSGKGSRSSDALKHFWPDFVRNPWLGPPGTVDVHHMGERRWSFEITCPEIEATNDADLRSRLRQELGQVLMRIGRSLSFDTRPSGPGDPSSSR